MNQALLLHIPIALEMEQWQINLSSVTNEMNKYRIEIVYGFDSTERIALCAR